MSEGPVPSPGLSGLDAGYVRDAAAGIAHYLRRDRACEIAYTPGNYTLYELVFVPVGSLGAAKDWMDSERARSIKQDRPELNHEEETMLILAWLGHGAMPLDLQRLPVDSYFAEKLEGCTLGDAAALRQLLLALADASGFRSLAVVR